MATQTHQITVESGHVKFEVNFVKLGYRLKVCFSPEVLSGGPNHINTMLMCWCGCLLRLQIVAAGSPLYPNWHELKWLSDVH
jgi:hypothetical protein